MEIEISEKTEITISIENLKKLIKETLKKNYKIESIAFLIQKQKLYKTSDQFQGAICKANNLNNDTRKYDYINMNSTTEAKIPINMILEIVKSHLRNEGFQFTEEPFVHFITKYSGDGQFGGNQDVFDGIKCIVNKTNKTIRIEDEK